MINKGKNDNKPKNNLLAAHLIRLSRPSSCPFNHEF